MFVLKETNGFNKYGLNDLVRERIGKKGKMWKGMTWHNIGRIAYGILNEKDSDYFKEADKNWQSVLQNIAVMNIKKTTGGNASNPKEIQKHVDKYGEFIKKQIDTINPDIVVLGGTYGFVKNLLGLKKISYRVHTDNKRVFVNCYHPAYRRINTKRHYQECVDSYLQYSNSKQMKNIQGKNDKNDAVQRSDR